MEKYEEIKKPIKQIFFDNFLGGIAWALGATFGLSLIVTFLTVILKNIDFIPIFGGFVSKITSYVLQNNPHLVK